MVLAAYGRALKAKFTEPSSSAAAKMEWRLEVDQVARFVEERCHRDNKAETPLKQLFDVYKSWASDEGVLLHMSKKGFRQRLTILGFAERRDSHVRYVCGLCLENGFG